MNQIFELNQILLIRNKKNGRKRTPKALHCLWCPTILNCEHKKIRVKGKYQKQYVPAKQYCNIPECGKKTLSFRFTLARKLRNPKNDTEFLTAQYCLWKMLVRTPIKNLAPIISKNFEDARPPYCYHIVAYKKNSEMILARNQVLEEILVQ